MASFPSNGRSRRAAGALAAAALCGGLLAGCGGSPSKSAAGGTTEPPEGAVSADLPADMAQKPACGLVTVAEVEAAIGARVVAGKQDVQAARSTCGFTLASAADQSVLLVLTSSSGVPAAFDTARARANGPQVISAGEAAFVAGGQAVVRKGQTMLVVVVALRQSPSQLAAAATKLAQAAGARL
jgi:hypothetical protein